MKINKTGNPEHNTTPTHRPEGVLRDGPARREEHKVGDGRARHRARRGQHREDRRVRVVVRDRVDRREARERVLVRRVVAVPGDNIKGREGLRGREEPPLELVEDRVRARPVLEPGDGGQEVARVGEAVAADRAEVGERERTAKGLEDVCGERLGGWVGGFRNL